MPSASTIVVADSVPVSRSYVPQSVSNSAVTLVDKTTASFISGQSTMIWDFSPVNTKRKTDRISARLNLPKVAVVSGVDTVDSVARGIVDIIIPETWTSLDRANFMALFVNMVSNAVFKGYVTTRDPMY